MPATLTSVFIDLVKTALGISRDVELAMRLGIAKSTVASWRVRGVIPKRQREEMERLSGVNLVDARRKFYSSSETARDLAKIAVFCEMSNLFTRIEENDERIRIAVGLAFSMDEILKMVTERIAERQRDALTEDNILPIETALGLWFVRTRLITADELRAWADAKCPADDF